MKTCKRILSLLLVAVMLLGVLPVQAVKADFNSEISYEPLADSGAVKVEHDGKTTYYATLQKAFDGFAPTNYEYGGTYVVTLLGDTEGVSKNLQFPTEVLDVTLDLNGHTITGPSGTSTTSVNINFGSKNSKDCVFTIKDSSGNNSGKITGGKNGVIFSGSASTLNFDGGTITGNSGSTVGGGIKLGGNCYFNMTGGVITGNSVTGTSSTNTGLGGGIYGVYINITGGEIYGNYANGGTGKYTGRGGGVCTDITGTNGYHYVNIGANAKIYDNHADNAGDDLMIQKNASNSGRLTFIVPTANWYIDGMNGQNQASDLIDRYSEENPVPYTDGGWNAGTKKAVGLKYVEAAPSVPTHTVTYTDGVENEEVFADQVYTVDEGSATPEFNGTPEWEGYIFTGWDPKVAKTVTGNVTYTATWEKAAPAAPEQSNVTEKLVAIICVSDPNHETVYGKWYPLGHCETTSDIVWDEELGTWTVDIKIGSLYIMYVDQLEDANNGIIHELVEDITTVYATLKWDAEQSLWVPTEDIELHTTCKTKPDAPVYKQMDTYQVKVKGDIDGDGEFGEPGTQNSGVNEVYTTSIPENGYTLSEVYGSREEGFFVDVTFNITEDDIYQKNWIDHCDPDKLDVYVYDWDKTEAEVTFTLKYTGSLTGTLYGNRHSNGNYDWVWEGNNKHYGVVTEAYLKAASFILTLDPNGGKVDPTSIEVIYGEAIGELPEATRSGYIFDGWVDADGNEVTAETIYDIADDSTITAQWIRHPGSSSQNVTKELFTIQCTEVEDHSWLVNWFGSHVSLVKDSVKWNEELGRWEAQCKIGSSMLSQINSTQPKKNYFGGIKHYYDVTDYVFDLYYDPDFTGLNSQNKEVTGMWLPVKDYVVDVYCYDEPSMPNVSKITSCALWVRDADYDMRNATYSTKYTIKQLIDGTYTLSDMYTENGKFYVDLTITNLAPYIEALSAKNGRDYAIGDWENHYNEAADFVFKLTYTGSTTDYKQDGTGWSVDASSYATTKEKNNGKSLWLTAQYTVTYTDGVEGEEVFADQTYTVNAFSENGGTKDDWADFSATATPAFEGEPTRSGYVFKGWSPEVAETVTEDVVYTAIWNKLETVNVVIYRNGNTTTPYKTVSLPKVEHGETFDVSTLDITDYYSSTYGYEFDGWFNDGKWNEYKAGKNPAGLTEITINGWTNIICMVNDKQPVYANIYRDGNTSKPVVSKLLGDYAFGTSYADILAEHGLTDSIDSLYTKNKAAAGYEWDGIWSHEISNYPAPVGDRTVNGWTNLCTMVYDQYKVNYHLNGEVVHTDIITARTIADYKAYEVEVQTGYTFDGWYEAEKDIGNEAKKEPFPLNPLKKYELYGTYTANTYTVTLDANGGEVEPETVEVTYGEAYELPTPTREGYTFVGWMDSEGNMIEEGSVVDFAGDETLTAVWEINVYTVTFDDGTNQTTVEVTHGQTVDEPKKPSKPLHIFIAWYLDGKEYDFSTPVTGDITLVAVWVDFGSDVPVVPNPGSGFGTSTTPVTSAPKVKNLNTEDHVAYIVGYEDGTVQPNNTITRAEIATIFFRLMTDDAREKYWSTTNAFEDVASTAWYNTAVSTLDNAGVIVDCTKNFRPNEPITRAELAVLAAQFCSVKSTGSASTFSDVSASHWAAKEIALVQQVGWIEGFNGEYRPNDTITRAEAITIINRMLQRAVDEDGMLAGMNKFSDNLPTAWYYEAVQEATNSHTYTRTNEKVSGEGYCYEQWIKLVAAPDWAALEASWAAKN